MRRRFSGWRAPSLFAAAMIAVTCGGPPSTPDPPNQPVQNAAPVIQSITVAAASRTEVDTDVDVSAAVQDAETAIANLTFNWTANAGTFTGTGAAVKWRLPAGSTTPVDVAIRLEVVERYASFSSTGAPITAENRVSRDAAASFRVHDSRAEISKITVRFLVDLFGNSAVSPEACLVDFWDGCGGKAAELGDIRVNRNLFVVLEASAQVQSITFRGPDDADVVATCRWRDRVIANGSTGVSQGPCLLTAVYRASRWWLCESTVDKTGLFTRTCDDGTSSCVPSGSSASYRYRRWRDLEVR
ncbi:MAG TPA: hypothetical protein VFV98_16070 [Vicinamibacterales bacterium]|nr:hypothetical protein [Vicinamibacterales bacterium]